ncbi:MAG: SpaA isopeptide-forming pilin-related protein, partial [Lachnospiraceae bacterium]|nr:SpaA isopeptide-forming pilin-related protein [Lachnospiraceae bacterium]
VIVETIYGETLEWISGDEPKVITGIPAGDYILREISAPNGYTVAEDVPFTLTDELEVENKVVMEDAPIEVKISKTDITTDEELPGATLQVLRQEDDELVIVETIYGETLEWISGDEPKVITGIPAGEYILREISAPSGYTVAEDVPFTLTDELKVENKVVMEDAPIEVEISKTDITTGEELPGATLQILRQEGEELVVVENVYGETLEWISGDEPKVITGIPAGDYILREISAPNGYIVAEDVPFTLTDELKVENKVLMEDTPTIFEISKVAITGGEEIEGAVLQILDKDGEVVAEWTSQAGKAHELQAVLVVGETYTLHEVEAPKGYNLAEDIEFTVEETGEIQRVEMVDDIYNGRLEVTKKLYYHGHQIQVEDEMIFYCALFKDAELTEMYIPEGDTTSVRELNMTGVPEATVVYEDLPYGTYYVSETDEDGNPITEMEYVLPNGDTVIIKASLIGEVAEITKEGPSAEAQIHNEFDTPPGGFDYLDDGQITITKNVTSGGAPHAVTATFYCALFFDEELEIRATDVAELVLENNSTTEVTFENLPEGDYYLAETDEDGNPIDPADSTFPFTIVQTKGAITVTEGGHAYAEIENQVKPEKEKPKKPEEPGKGVKTGDETNYMLYILLLVAAALVAGGTVIVGRRKKNRR